MSEKILKSILTIVFLGLLSASVQAAPVILGWGGEEIIKVADFPNTEEFENGRGEYFDAGYVYKQVTIFFIPVWNYDGKWVGYVGEKNGYLLLKKAELDRLAAKANVRLPETPSLPFWDSIGGKLVFGLILLLYLGWKFLSAATDVQAEAPVEEA
jgi:hypothetical protein